MLAPGHRRAQPARANRAPRRRRGRRPCRRSASHYPTCVLHGNLVRGLHEDSLILRLAEPDRAEFLSRYGAALFEPMPGRPMKEYVVVPPAMVDSGEVGDWVRRSLTYAGQLPPKKTKKRG